MKVHVLRYLGTYALHRRKANEKARRVGGGRGRGENSNGLNNNFLHESEGADT